MKYVSNRGYINYENIIDKCDLIGTTLEGTVMECFMFI